jgi:hypothetical protein
MTLADAQDESSLPSAAGACFARKPVVRVPRQSPGGVPAQSRKQDAAGPTGVVLLLNKLGHPVLADSWQALGRKRKSPQTGSALLQGNDLSSFRINASVSGGGCGALSGISAAPASAQKEAPQQAPPDDRYRRRAGCDPAAAG